MRRITFGLKSYGFAMTLKTFFRAGRLFRDIFFILFEMLLTKTIHFKKLKAFFSEILISDYFWIKNKSSLRNIFNMNVTNNPRLKLKKWNVLQNLSDHRKRNFPFQQFSVFPSSIEGALLVLSVNFKVARIWEFTFKLSRQFTHCFM